MILRHQAPGTPKPPITLPLLALIAAISIAVLSRPAGADTAEGALAPVKNERLSPVETAEFRPDGKVITRIERALNLPAGRVYDNVTAQVAGSLPPTRNGNTGQIAMFIPLFIFLSAVMLLMWRHARRDDASPRRIGRRI